MIIDFHKPVITQTPEFREIFATYHTLTEAEYDLLADADDDLPAHIASLSAFEEPCGRYHVDGRIPLSVAREIIEGDLAADAIEITIDGSDRKGAWLTCYAPLETALAMIEFCKRHNREGATAN